MQIRVQCRLVIQILVAALLSLLLVPSVGACGSRGFAAHGLVLGGCIPGIGVLVDKIYKVLFVLGGPG